MSKVATVVKIEQFLIWLGILTLAWMTYYLLAGERVPENIRALFDEDGIWSRLLAVFFLGGLAGMALLAANLGRGVRGQWKPRVTSAVVFLLALAVFGRFYAGSYP